MALTLVLSVGLDAMLLSTRNSVLQSAGYFVVPAFSLKEAVDHIRNGDFDLVLLCQSIPAQERDRLTIWIRASGSRIPVVLVSSDRGERDAFTDSTVDSAPNALLAGITQVLINAATQVARATDREKREATAAREKKAPKSSSGYEQESGAKKELSVPFARVG